MQKIRKILRADSEKTASPTNQPNIEVSDFGLIWRPFCEYLQSNSFFKNPALSLLYLYSPLTSCKISEKSLDSFLRKLHYQPTNQISKCLILSSFGDVFANIFKSRIFFKNLAVSLFYLYSPLT